MFQPPSKLVTLLVLLFLSTLAVSIWFFRSTLNQQSNPEPYTKYLNRFGELTIGFNPKSPPMEYLDEKGHPRGFDIDLGTHIADEMGLESEFKAYNNDQPPGELLNALKIGEVDIIISSFISTDELKDKYDISVPYLEAGAVDSQKKGSYFVIVLRKGEKQLVNKINSVLSNLQQKGVVDRLREKWFE